MVEPIRLALVGVGKIARDQHLPAIAADERFRLAATVDPKGGVDGVPHFADLDALIASRTEIDAVTLATPPGGRGALAIRAMEARFAVMLEKPPAATLSEAEDLRARAEAAGVSLFACWHSRAADGVAPARAWLAERTVTGVRITWKEDVRRWHPGQEWILGPGGFGVFDPGINALSIVTEILPDPLFVTSSRLSVPQGRAAPIAASLQLRTGAAEGIAEFDFRQTGPQTWDIEVDTDAGTLTLREGGSVLELPDGEHRRGDNREYPALYARFADLIAGRQSDVDVRPLRLVADAMLVAALDPVEAFRF
jgi:D-galactose 1-dehydrogenase/L-arabinose 1- dehydrogenase